MSKGCRRKGGRGFAVGWHSESMVTLPPWAPGEGSVSLLLHTLEEDRAIFERSSPEHLDEEEGPYWWILSGLERFEGKEAREEYYAKL